MIVQDPSKGKKIKNAFFIYIIIISTFAAFIGGMYIGRSYWDKLPWSNTRFINTEVPSELKDVDFSLFWEAYQILDKKYVNRPLDKEKVLYGAIDGMVSSLDDPYTAFMNPEMTQEFDNEIHGTFEGIGIEIGIKNNLLTVIAPVENTPAWNAGLKPRDIILTINDQSTLDIQINEAVKLIRGPKGSTVKLTIKRDGVDASQEFEITRDTIEVKSVEYEQKENGIFYIKITRFSESTTKEFDEAIQELLKSDSKKIVLDLRNNPGGFLESSIDISSEFIEKGVVVTEEFSENEKNNYKARGRARLESFTTVILVNEGSASASEIVAGALQDQKGVKLIGKKTYGKGSVQEFEDLPGGSSIRVTVAKWLTPNGININENGIEPTIEVDLTDDDYNNDRDPQLDKAIEILSQ